MKSCTQIHRRHATEVAWNTSNRNVDANVLRRIADKQGNLQRNRAVFDEIEGILTDVPIKIKGVPAIPRVSCPELLLADQNLTVAVEMEASAGPPSAIRISLTDENGKLVDARSPVMKSGHTEAAFSDLAPGAHTVTVAGLTATSPAMLSASEVIVWGSPDGIHSAG